jgi:hypothetical protein
MNAIAAPARIVRLPHGARAPPRESGPAASRGFSEWSQSTKGWPRHGWAAPGPRTERTCFPCEVSVVVTN